MNGLMIGYFSASGGPYHTHERCPFGFAIPVELMRRGEVGIVKFVIFASGCTSPMLWRFPCGNSKSYGTALLQAQRLQEYRK
jgi:hypothetical protein